MKALLLAMALLLPITAHASDAEAQADHPLVKIYFSTAACAAITGGGTAGSGDGVDLLAAANLEYETAAAHLAERLINNVPGWEDADPISMRNSVAEYLQGEPQPEIQEIGERCMDIYQQYQQRLNQSEAPEQQI